MNLDQVLQTFLDESRELLADMERILLELESNPNDSELHNALFRCVHTVKGSAGMFGLDHVVDFTHVVENVLDRLRAEEIQLSHGLANLLLRSRDHISLLVEVLDPADAGQLAPASAELLHELTPFQSLPHDTTSTSEAQAPESAASGLWRLHLSVHEDAFRHGMDPLSFIQYLTSLGELQTVMVQLDSLPPFAEADPETCYLDFAITLQSDADRATLEDVFALADDLYQLTLTSTNHQDAPSTPAVPSHQQHLIGQYLTHHGLLEPSADKPSAAPADHQEDANGPRKKAAQQLRVQADKLDHLINLVGELVISSAAVTLNAGKSNDTTTRESATSLGLLVEEIRDSTLELRMVPIGETFQRFQRVVRDVAAELSKNIQLVITGADTELDKTVVEKIGDPL
ncbi:MAG: Hpt domain-containing protein, partial [Natronospirillum sp.]